MEIRLVQLLGSFISTTSDYTLARLEFTLRHPSMAPPPVIERLADASEFTLLTQWAQIEHQLEAARHYLKRIDDRRGKRAVYDQSYAFLQRAVRELDQYARAVRWVMTVDDRSAQ